MAPRDHPGRSREQQDGHEVANNRIFVDFGVIPGPVDVSFWVQNALNIILFLGLLPGHFLAISNSNVRRLGLPNRCSRMESIAKIDFSWKSFLKNFGIDF